jgi:opacity protein-like surface antigen
LPRGGDHRWVRVEYRHADLGAASFRASAAFNQGIDARVKENSVRAGIAYEFDFGAPIIGRFR